MFVFVWSQIAVTGLNWNTQKYYEIKSVYFQTAAVNTEGIRSEYYRQRSFGSVSKFYILISHIFLSRDEILISHPACHVLNTDLF
jgi:hypothetical protein